MSTAPDLQANEPSADEVDRLGIVRIATERFEVGGYRYERLADALAEARRRSAPGGGH